MSAHPVQWVTASPLWPSVLAGEPEERFAQMRRPALLRFERDTFMDDLGRQLEREPAGLSTFVATPITYQLPAPGEAAPPVPTELKLFQAVHGHFYLVAASLTCRLPGLPEHDVNPAAGERVSFVLRRQDDAGRGEWAWVLDPSMPDSKQWKLRAIGTVEAIDPAEELLPLFPVRYADGERLRRVYVGLVPTASGDAFRAAGALSPLAPAGSGTGGLPADPRPASLKTKVTDPLRALIANPPAAAPDLSPADAAGVERAAADQQVEASRFLLLDFAQFLNGNLDWFAVDPPIAPVQGGEAVLWSVLGAEAVPGSGLTWIAAVATAWRERRIISGDDPTGAISSLALNLGATALDPDTIDMSVIGALPPLPPPDPGSAMSIQGDLADPPAVPKLDAGSASRYILRCVYQRPRCGPLQPDIVSGPSDPFRIAGFFDFDAPSRSITIAMPVDTSIKDLRKLRKNVNFLLSNQLRAQMNRVTSLKAALNGQMAAGDSVDLGLVCSFSMPIITICALIVLMVFINLLNIVFWWMPFLRICFPIGLKAGGE